MASYKYTKTSNTSEKDVKNKNTSAPAKNTKDVNRVSQKGNTQKKTDKRAPVREKKERDPDSIVNQILPYLWGLLAFCIAFCLLFTVKSGFIGKIIVKPILCGLFGWGAAVVPFLICIRAFLWKKDIETDTVLFKFIASLFVVISMSVIIHVIATSADAMTFSPKTLWTNGMAWKGGGVIGGFLGGLFVAGIDKPLTLCIFIPMTLIFTTFVFGFTPSSAFVALKEKVRESRDRLEEFEEEQKVWHSIRDKKKLKISDEVYEPDTKHGEVDMSDYDDAVRRKAENKNKENAEETAQSFDPDVDLGESGSAENDRGKESIFPFRKPKKATVESVSDISSAKPLDDVKLDDIFDEKLIDEIKGEKDISAAAEIDDIVRTEVEDCVPDAKELELMVERKQLKPDTAAAPVPAPVKEYVFPPHLLLNIETNSKNEDASEEMRSTAIKLVETLRSFKVKTRIIDVSRGPSITRYELAPEEGVRVRAIANLVDDISLNLATSGVRIEAPIPGKAAVGIEVPNKVVSTVYLRELLETQQFKTAKSRVTVALGMDVAGAPILLDIAKMPHLLIAGATGMGKSVCINSMIVSLLYKATPDEVKLILIDPKKVELSIYNGLPHLLVPVVTDPKKAAGSLHWAVTEMDRRFELIEEVGVRDIASYNRITKDDPDKEFLPQIVIVIDELADLMMTAPKEVEDSICRLAQKARAAGMHLVIGTQRPSVDVVTGLIKANVPSRIAFTMASQVDSRTIIDVAGAEKLIGRGDMLYAPVGFSKPVRVQGSFVSESEIEKITEFIKTNSGVSSYDANVIESIEKEAMKCGEGKNVGGEDEDGDDSDPLFRAAVELAVEAGKISTSLLQRRLSVGYGRAAKLIDKMEQRGIVSAPEGQKPRSVLISRHEFMEMSLKNDD